MVDGAQIAMPGAAPDAGPVTGRVRIALLVGGGVQVAWWCCMCLLLLSTLGAKRMHFDFLTFETDTSVTMGTITSVQQETIHKPGGVKSYHYAHAFSYEIDGKELFGRAYSSQMLKQGSTVEVEYVIMAPRSARVVGTTTQRTSGMILVIGAAAFFLCIAWTLGRVTGWNNRKHAARAGLSSQQKTATWGLLPKLRMNRYGELTTRGGAWLLLAPIASIALMVLVSVLIDI